MLNHYAEWGSEHLALPRIMPSILLTCHLITSVLAFIITNAKSDFAPFEDSGSTNRSIIISQNNYVALKEREKKKIKLLDSAFLWQGLACCGSVLCEAVFHGSLKLLHPHVLHSLQYLSHLQKWLSKSTTILSHSFLPSSLSSHF